MKTEQPKERMETIGSAAQRLLAEMGKRRDKASGGFKRPDQINIPARVPCAGRAGAPGPEKRGAPANDDATDGKTGEEFSLRPSVATDAARRVRGSSGLVSVVNDNAVGVTPPMFKDAPDRDQRGFVPLAAHERFAGPARWEEE